MKNIKKSSLVFGLVFFILLGSYLAINSKPAIAEDFNTTGSYYVSFKIIEANYGDFDQDSYEDDIIVKATLNINFIGPVIAFLFFDLTLPSGTTYFYSFKVSFISNGSQILITIISYNTAIEAGWYKAKLIGFFIYDNYIFIRTTSTTFDPPTPGPSPGEPGIDLTITYAD